MTKTCTHNFSPGWPLGSDLEVILGHDFFRTLRQLTLARTGATPPPLRRRRVAPPGLELPYGANLAQFLAKKKLTGSGQVTELWRHKRNNLRQLNPRPTGVFFITRPTGGGGLFRAPPSDLRNYWTDSKNSSGIWKPWKNCRRKTNFIDLRVTSDVTGQVKVKMFDISGLVTLASKIAMLSTNKAN